VAAAPTQYGQRRNATDGGRTAVARPIISLTIATTNDDHAADKSHSNPSTRRAAARRKEGSDRQDRYTVKNIRISADISVASFPRFKGTGSAYVCIRKSTE